MTNENDNGLLAVLYKLIALVIGLFLLALAIMAYNKPTFRPSEGFEMRD